MIFAVGVTFCEQVLPSQYTSFKIRSSSIYFVRTKYYHVATVQIAETFYTAAILPHKRPASYWGVRILPVIYQIRYHGLTFILHALIFVICFSLSSVVAVWRYYRSSVEANLTNRSTGGEIAILNFLPQL